MPLPHKMTSQTKACLIGHPVAHSRSPIIHRHWLKTLGIDGSYDLVDLPPEGLDGFLDQLRQGVYSGCNVTIPHKESMFDRVDRTDDTAKAVGAVNTVWIEGGKIIGGNSDVHGFMANLDESVPQWQETTRQVVILGAGGAARACTYGLVERGMRVALVNRTKARADELAVRFGAAVTAHSDDETEALLGEADLLVNTTSLGMQGKEPLRLDISRLRPNAIVHDIVYVPLRTRLLDEAAARGHRTVTGLGMLLHQAVAGFEKWFGARPAVTPDLRSLIEADIIAKTPSS